MTQPTTEPVTEWARIAPASRGLTKTYHSTDPPTRIVDDVDLSVANGEFLVVMDALTDVHRSRTTLVMVTHDPGCAAWGSEQAVFPEFT